MPFQKGNKLYKLRKITKLTDEQKQKISNTLKMKKIIPPSRKGIKDNEETRKKKSNAQKLRIKNNNHNFWKGGKTKESKRFRRSVEYRLWRESVFARDNWTCQKCRKRCCELHPHHIKALSVYPELGLSIDNGITLCVDCHRKTDSYAGKGLKRKKTEKPLDSDKVNYKNNQFYQEVEL